MELTKQTAIFVQDQDSHWYVIHENQEEIFYELMNKGYETDDFDEFEKMNFKMIGMDPNLYRKNYLK